MTIVAQDIRLTRFEPAIFTLTDGTQAAILHASDGNLVTSAKPAKRGEYLSIYVTGLGPTKTKIPTGNTPSGDEAPTADTPQVLIAGVSVPATFSGLAPGNAGLYQINVQLPFEVYSGTDVKSVYAPPRSGDILHSLADIRRARDLLGYEPMVPFEEGLERTVVWYRANLGAQPDDQP